MKRAKYYKIFGLWDMTNIVWKKTKNRSLENLHLLLVDNREVGFIYKPKDTKTDKNAWRLHAGIGQETKFLGHEWSKTIAMTGVERHLGYA